MRDVVSFFSVVVISIAGSVVLYWAYRGGIVTENGLCFLSALTCLMALGLKIAADGVKALAAILFGLFAMGFFWMVLILIIPAASIPWAFAKRGFAGFGLCFFPITTVLAGAVSFTYVVARRRDLRFPPRDNLTEGNV